MADRYLLDTIKIGGNDAELLARSTDENVTTNYRDKTNITLKTALETIKGEIDSKSESQSYDEATTTSAGLMSSTDKQKLDGLRAIIVGEGDTPPSGMVEGDIYIKKI